MPDRSALEADICIVGAGAAGTTLATELIGSGLRVLVIESGGLAYDARTQALHAGVNAGLLYEPLDLCRVRTFGGSTDRRGWGGWCKPLADLDFEYRDWVPLSGWPIAKRDLAPYYRRAFATLSLDPETERLAEADRRRDDVLPLDSRACINEPCPLSPAPHLGEVTRDRLRAAGNVRVLLHANVTQIVTDEDRRTVTHLDVATLTGKTHTITAGRYVLAAGGIENARLMLLSNRGHAEGLGNASGYVGRCFMEHPRYAWGRLSGQHLAPLLRRYDPGTVVGHRRAQAAADRRAPLFGASLALSAEAQRTERLLGARTWLVPVSGGGDRAGGVEFKELVFWLKKRRLPSDLGRRCGAILRDLPNAAAAAGAHLMAKLRPAAQWQFITVLEQEPDPHSRITLDRSRDALGLQRVRLDWRIGELTRKTLRRTREIFCTELRSAGFDCTIAGPRGEGSNQDEEAPRWVWHHMGTTRMAADPKNGVVDAQCRVHGIANLYVAGSSVFPTVGNDMPTLTVVALAHRLADHLQGLFGRVPSKQYLPENERLRPAVAEGPLGV
ncbi:MAG TPA: GMC family oxidoreductase [Hyphomicrobiaceae bacterium]|nr:GMC family oxidoreductase [Hyphomicrobiaceae bacterium]